MQRFRLAALFLLLGISIAYAAEMAFVTSANMGYTAGETRPITVDTNGNLRVAC